MERRVGAQRQRAASHDARDESKARALGRGVRPRRAQGVALAEERGLARRVADGGHVHGIHAGVLPPLLARPFVVLPERAVVEDAEAEVRLAALGDDGVVGDFLGDDFDEVGGGVHGVRWWSTRLELLEACHPRGGV